LSIHSAAPISYRQHVESTCTVRNFSVRQEPALNLTIREAILVTLATPPLFSSNLILKGAAKFEYVSGELILTNPIREIISEARACFGPGNHVACLLSIGCDHPGNLSVPDDSDMATWNTFLRKIITNNEKEARNAARQMNHLGLYLRFPVDCGLNASPLNAIPSMEDTPTHTTSYLSDTSLSVERCVELLRLRNGISSVEQLGGWLFLELGLDYSN
jgi:hypothetical protein